MIDLAQTGASSANVSVYWTASTARADSAVADNSRGVHGKVTVVSTDANRDDPDLTGHRATECLTTEAA